MSEPARLLERQVTVRRLGRDRRRSTFLRWTVVAFGILVVCSWTTGEFSATDITSPRRVANLERFLGELRPLPLQGRDWNWAVAAEWTVDLLASRGGAAAAATLAMSIVAIVLAGLGALLLMLPAARTWGTPEPFAPGPRPPSIGQRGAWALIVWGTRALLVFFRAVPEYVWAFVLLTVIGPNAWTMVLALAVHNAGILGRLNAEVIENVPPAVPGALRSIGSGRAQVALAGILPPILPRFLLLLFYRWETCVREATALGMLGMVSLGFYIQDARARQHYDVMCALILVGSILVVCGDVLSARLRKTIRERGEAP